MMRTSIVTVVFGNHRLWILRGSASVKAIDLGGKLDDSNEAIVVRVIPRRLSRELVPIIPGLAFQISSKSNSKLQKFKFKL